MVTEEVEKLKTVMEQAYQDGLKIHEGKNADYIPFLAGVDPALTALTAVTREGEILSFGDDTFRFAIESISKVCTLVLAMEEEGEYAIRKKIGDSPTGLPFNSVMALELHKDKPLSPLVNAGAMATTSLVQAKDKEERWAKILEMQRQLMSEKVALSEAVNTSEQTTNFHNRALAWLLYAAGHMYSDPMEACEVYTRQCSTLVSSRDLAVMAGTLAFGGINPVTGARVLKEKNVPHILAEMMMEGLYDGSGDFAYLTGLPGKSGVGGGLMAVVPGVLGIAAFSPRLDAAGNSVRGQHMIRQVANTMGYNIFRG